MELRQSWGAQTHEGIKTTKAVQDQKGIHPLSSLRASEGHGEDPGARLLVQGLVLTPRDIQG